MELTKLRPLEGRVFYIHCFEQQTDNPLNISMLVNNARFFGAGVAYGREGRPDWITVSDVVDLNFSSEDAREKVLEKAEEEGVPVRTWHWMKSLFERLMADALLA